MDLKNEAFSHRGHRYVAFLVRHSKTINFATLALTAAALFFATKLYLKPSFSALLPDNLPSVQQLNRATDVIGGTGMLLIGIESPSFKANREFADKLAQEITNLNDPGIRDLEHHFKEPRKYLERFGLFYLKKDELLKLRDRLKKEIEERSEKKKNQAFASFLGLNDDEKEDTKKVEPSESNELSQSFDPRIQRILQYPKDYLASDDGKLMVISVRTAGSSLSVGDSKKLVTKIHSIINILDPTKYNKNMTVNFAGNVQRSIDEVETVKHDIVDTAVLLIILILATLYVFFQSITLVGLLSINLLMAVVWTLGFAQISIGYLNTLTAFLSSLVVGTGINYSCILISRFIEEKKAGFNTKDSLAQAIAACALPTLAGSSTTAVSFIALYLADNRGFSEFATIGGMGIMLCWIAAFTLLPIWIWQIDKRVSLVNTRLGNARRVGNGLAWIGSKVIHRPFVFGMLLTALSVSSIWITKSYLVDPFEYDFRKLGNKVSYSKEGASFLHKRIQDEVFRSSLTPAVVLLNSEEQGRVFCSTVRKKVDSLPTADQNLEGCLSIGELLPRSEVLSDESPEKAKIRQEVRALMGSKWLKYSDSKLAEVMLNINKYSENRAPRLEDLPEQLKRRFRTLTGKDAAVGLIYSDNSKPLEDGRNLLSYTNTFGKIELPDNLGTVSAAGENFVLADLLRSIRIDGPKTTLVSFIAVIAIAFFLAGELRGGFIMGLCLLSATIWMFGAQAAFNIKFNFLNFIALPLTFGIGIDYPINIYSRFKEQGYKDISGALRNTGAAVLLCSSTTIIGYLTLFEASNQALISFAKLALVGEFTCLAASFILLPLIFKKIKHPAE